MIIFKEINHEFKALKPDIKDFQKLGVTFFIILGLLGFYLQWSSQQFGIYLIGLSFLFGLVGIVFPKWLRPVYYLWMLLALILGFFVSRFLLAIIFYAVMTPIALILRCANKDLLDKKYKDRDSYWNDRSEEKYNPQKTEKMY